MCIDTQIHRFNVYLQRFEPPANIERGKCKSPDKSDRKLIFNKNRF